MATLRWIGGFEGGSLGSIVLGASTAAEVTSTMARTGNYSMLLHYSSNYARIPFATDVSEVYVRFAFKPMPENEILYDEGRTGIPRARLISLHNPSDGLYGWLKYDQRKGTLEVLSGGSLTNIETYGGNIRVNKWQTIEFYYKVGNNPDGRTTVKINGITTLDQVGDSLGMYGSAYIRYIYIGSKNHVDRMPFYIDDIALATDGWIGRGGVQALLPTSDVSVQMTPSTGTDNYALIGEVPLSDVDYVQAETGRDLYGLSDPTNSGTIYAVQWTSRAKTSATPATITPVVQISGTEYEGTAQNLTTSLANYFEIMTENPATSSAWSEADVDDLVGGQKVT